MHIACSQRSISEQLDFCVLNAVYQPDRALVRRSSGCICDCIPHGWSSVVCRVKEATLSFRGRVSAEKAEQIKKADKEGTNPQAATQPDCGPGHGLILPQAQADTWTLPRPPACRPRVRKTFSL